MPEGDRPNFLATAEIERPWSRNVAISCNSSVLYLLPAIGIPEVTDNSRAYQCHFGHTYKLTSAHNATAQLARLGHFARFLHPAVAVETGVIQRILPIWVKNNLRGVKWRATFGETRHSQLLNYL